MANMFDTYDNLSNQYIPSNMNKNNCPGNANPPLYPREPKKPYEEYNDLGELIGYWWSYGDTINLEFELEGNVDITGSNNYVTARDFIQNKQILITLYNFRHEEITKQLYDGNSKQYQDYTFKVAPYVNSKTNGVYYTFDKVNNKYTKVMLPEAFSYDETYYTECPVTVIYGIDKELSLKLVPGVYYCSLAIIDNSINATVLDQEEVALNVR